MDKNVQSASFSKLERDSLIKLTFEFSLNHPSTIYDYIDIECIINIQIYYDTNYSNFKRGLNHFKSIFIPK